MQNYTHIQNVDDIYCHAKLVQPDNHLSENLRGILLLPSCKHFLTLLQFAVGYM